MTLLSSEVVTVNSEPHNDPLTCSLGAGRPVEHRPEEGLALPLLLLLPLLSPCGPPPQPAGVDQVVMIFNVPEDRLPLPSLRQGGQLLVLRRLATVEDVHVDRDGVLQGQARVQHVQPHF